MEYKALAQNTLKVITETTVKYNGAIGLPDVLNIPRIKMISPDGASVHYLCLNPSSVNVWTGETGIFQHKYITSYKPTTKDAAVNLVYTDCKKYTDTAEACNAAVDGIRYYGQKSALYSSSLRYKVNDNGILAEIKSRGVFPACMVRAVLYSQAGNTIVSKETSVDSFTPDTVAPVNNTSYYAAYSIEGLAIKKEENDIVIAIEIEYPKHDISLSGNAGGLQYSLDDGATFHNVGGGFSAEQIEHIIFKNPDATEHVIGTDITKSDIATIDAGGTKVVIPTTDGAWVVS